LPLCLIKYHTINTYPVLKHYAMKTYGGIEVWLYMLTSALDGDV